MSSFTEEGMVSKLNKLNNTMHSIQTLSLWLIHHRKHSHRIVEIWAKEVKKTRDPEKLLSLVYLMNDVIQNSRKKWPLFAEQLHERLENTFSHFAKYCNEKTLLALKRVIAVWKERTVYDTDSIDRLTYALTSNLGTKNLAIFADKEAKTPKEPVKTPPKPSSPVPPKAKVPKIQQPTTPPRETKSGDAVDEKNLIPMPTTDQILQTLKILQEPASADAAIREKIASFPESIANVANLDNIANEQQANEILELIAVAEPCVSEYCERLKGEMQVRRSGQQQIVSYLHGQKKALEQTRQLLGEFQERKTYLNAEREEIYKHFESLPDLSKLPSPTQLPPLPTAGDLFRR